MHAISLALISMFIVTYTNNCKWQPYILESLSLCEGQWISTETLVTHLPVVKITVGHWSISVHFLRMTAHNSTRAVGVGTNDQSKSVVDRTIIKPYFDHCLLYVLVGFTCLNACDTQMRQTLITFS